MYKITFTILLILSIFNTGVVYAAGDTLPQHLLVLSGRSAGICSMPRCGDGKLAIEIAQHSQLLVHAMSDDPALVSVARKAANDAGLYNRTVYVEDGSAATNPLADWCADVLLITDAADVNLAQIGQQDVRRVLSPYRGVAIVGRAKVLGAGLTREKLATWIAGLHVPNVKIVEDDFGLWAVATMPPLAGGDDWTHYAHGADQNRVSTDTMLKWPYQMQWTAKPYYDGKFDMAVAAGGRVFRANATLAVLDRTRTDGIIARDAYNGRVLWMHKTADDFGGFGSLIVATPEFLYVKDGNGVLQLDAETGAERQRFALSEDPQLECKWLLLQDGVLVSVLGPRSKFKSLRELPMNGIPVVGHTDADMADAQQRWYREYDRGTALIATDVASGKELWRTSADWIDPAKVVTITGRVFYYADHAYASCLDLRSGHPLWKTDAPMLKDPAAAGTFFLAVGTQRVGALASAEV